MDNYKLKQKILKTKPVTYYRASHSSSTQTYVVKKLNKPYTWEEVLESKSLTLCKNSKSKYIAKIKEIIKEDNSFYCIMENSQLNLTELIKNDIDKKDIFKIARQLIQLILGLYEDKILIRDIRPSHLFANKNTLKLYHFETVSQKDFTQLDMTELQDMRYIAPEEVLTKKGYNEKSLIFSIGLIICEVILGEPLINAKNKLEYIYQLTHLFPNERVDKMKGSQHEFKQIQSSKSVNFTQKMLQQSQIGPAFISLLQNMLKIDHSQRIPLNQVLQAFNTAIQNEQNFHKNKDENNKQNKLINLPNKNQADIQSQMVYQIEFEFQNKPTLSSIPLIFTQKSKNSPLLPEEQNVQDDGKQPIIIKQASSTIRGRQLKGNVPLQQGLIQKANPIPKSIGNLNTFSNTKKSSIPPLYSTQSPSHMLLHNNTHPSELFNPNINLEHLKNSRSTKQTTLNTIKKPQLTNYALNEANLGLKVGMGNTLFSENNFDEEEFL